MLVNQVPRGQYELYRSWMAETAAAVEHRRRVLENAISEDISIALRRRTESNQV
jgi:hypothetical protein